MGEVPEGSLAEKSLRTKESAMFDVEIPRLTSVFGAGDVVDATKVTTGKTKREKLVAPLDNTACEAIFDGFLQGAGVAKATVDEDDVLSSMAEIFVSGTSNIAVANASILVADERVSLSHICRSASLHCDAANSVRLWVRSFRDGEMMCRISDMLDNPENVALRQRALARYSSPDRFAWLCFDTVKHFSRISPLKYIDRTFVRMMKDVKFAKRVLTLKEMCWFDENM